MACWSNACVVRTCNAERRGTTKTAASAFLISVPKAWGRSKGCDHRHCTGRGCEQEAVAITLELQRANAHPLHAFYWSHLRSFQQSRENHTNTTHNVWRPTALVHSGLATHIKHKGDSSGSGLRRGVRQPKSQVRNGLHSIPQSDLGDVVGLH